MSKQKTGAAFSRGSSKQDYATPRDFLKVVERHFGRITFDLAANQKNAVCASYFNSRENALKQDWTKLRGLLWLNPPFNNITPWAKKCAETLLGGQRTNLLFLVPASVGAIWYAEHVHSCASIYALRPRMSFDGKHPYPKDLILAHYSSANIGVRLRPWDYLREPPPP